MAKYICATCGKEFESDYKSKTPKYCSRYCHNHVKSNSGVCEVCGRPLPKFASKYCSKQCREQLWNANESRPAHGLLHKTCLICGKEFDTYRSRKKTCSDECSKILRGKRPSNNKTERNRKQYLSKHPNACKVGVTVRQCKFCGVDFVIEHQSQMCCCKEHAKKYANQREHEKKLSERVTKTCCVCGKEFLDWKKGQRITCSPECSKEREAAMMKINREKRYTKENVVDTNITLKRVFNRDGGKCYICGCDCDWSDFTRNADGYFCTGKKYPTIEHVIPLNRGGKHAWSNVRLACAECNFVKSDNLPDNFQVEFAATLPKIHTPGATQAKKTLQFALDGTLLAEYESSADAARKTGFKAKQIQNCCRGENPRYRGFIWKYA